MLKKYLMNSSNMSLSNHPENVIPASINKRDGLLDDILYYIAEA
jgi:hypothetical protein